MAESKSEIKRGTGGYEILSQRRKEEYGRKFRRKIGRRGRGGDLGIRR